MVLGNIIYNGNLEFNDNFKYYPTIDSVEDKNLPTLFIGYSKTKELYPKIKVLDRKINNLIYWTFNKNENTKIMSNDMFNFMVKCHYEYIKQLKYIFIDPITNNKNILKKIYLKISTSKTIKLFEDKNKMFYLNVDDLIFGIDLNFFEFIGFDGVKLKNNLINKSTVYSDYNNINSEIKLFNDIVEDKKFTPFLL